MLFQEVGKLGDSFLRIRRPYVDLLVLIFLLHNISIQLNWSVAEQSVTVSS